MKSPINGLAAWWLCKVLKHHDWQECVITFDWTEEKGLGKVCRRCGKMATMILFDGGSVAVLNRDYAKRRRREFLEWVGELSSEE